MINSSLLVNALCEQGFYICDHFLDEQVAYLLQHNALALIKQGKFRPARIGNLTNTKQNTSIRTDKIYWLDESFPNIKPFWQVIMQIKLTLNEQLYLSLTELETHFAFYQTGSFYKKHIDQFKNNYHRKISFVYYLNPNWQPDYGGQLTLYNQENQLITSILPTYNRFICFLSHLPHEVQKTTIDRLSITGWLKTKASLLI
ncbi:2OG-Fe(II) oxygenase [Legionella sp. D16C41]|uniref:2OG-Fe(II) oxygenase n=1 Tax=Legionella sp. D16C41 TaxID=3402688 RepID=UPI003AF6DF30